MHEEDQGQERIHPVIPLISDNTREAIARELGLDKDTNTFWNETGMHPRDGLNGLTTETFESLTTFNRGATQVILDSLRAIYRYSNGEINFYHINRATYGMAVMLRAYQLETNGSLIPGFENLGIDELEAIKSVLHESISFKPSDDALILQDILEAPRLPEHNVNINYCVNHAAKLVTPGEREFRQGAIAMYRVLSSQWGKLNPTVS